MKSGMVYLVGAGPGDPGLITMKAVTCLRRAHVVIYDRLVNRRLLRYAPPGCELIRRGEEVGDQQEINDLMAARAAEGRVVVRLKGGDPFLFGRGGEEMAFLAEAGIPFEVVPGVSAALAAPAYAGIPLTHRQFSSTVTITTGHEAAGKAGSSINWQALCRGADTLVILMGMGNLPQVVEQLLASGLRPDSHVAVISRGTLPSQKALVSTLGRVVEDVKAQGLSPPAAIVVGRVAQLRGKASWFERKPLFGRNILVVGAEARAARLADLLGLQGAQVIELPVIRIVPDDNAHALHGALRKLASYAWVVFTSDSGVRLFWRRLRDLGLDARALSGVKVAAIGPSTAASLARVGIQADLIPKRYCVQGLLEAFAACDLRGRKVMLARSSLAGDELPRALRAMGALVDEFGLYHPVAAQIPGRQRSEIKTMLARGTVDMIAFTSASAAQRFGESFGRSEAAGPMEGIPIACLGPKTARVTRSLGLSVTVVADPYTLEGLACAILRHLRKER